jgi:hypothetical protein
MVLLCRADAASNGDVGARLYKPVKWRCRGAVRQARPFAPAYARPFAPACARPFAPACACPVYPRARLSVPQLRTIANSLQLRTLILHFCALFLMILGYLIDIGTKQRDVVQKSLLKI